MQKCGKLAWMLSHVAQEVIHYELPRLASQRKGLHFSIAMAASSSDAPAMLTGPKVLIDALPYIDQEYNDPKVKAQVDALIAAELKTFKPPRDYLEKFPEYEPTFRVCILYPRCTNEFPTAA